MRKQLIAALTVVVVAACSPPNAREPAAGDAATAVDSQVGADAGTALEASTPPTYGDPLTGEGWVPVPGSENCDVRAADLAHVTFPARTWMPCGPGCRASVGSSIAGDEMLAIPSSVVGSAADPWLASVMVRAAPLRLTFQLSRLEDGKTIAAFASHSTVDRVSCALRPTGSDWLLVADNDGRGRVAHLDSAGVATWAPAWAELPSFTALTSTTSSLDVVSSGRIWRFGPTLAPPTSIATATGGVFSVYDDDVHVFWAGGDEAGRRVLRGLEGGFAKTFLTTSAYLASVARSGESRLVWMEVTHPEAEYGGMDSGAIVWSSAPATPADLSPIRGPALPGIGYSSNIAASPRYAAVITSNAGAETSMLNVVSFADRRLWTIRAHPGKRIYRILGITDREVIVAEAPASGPEATTQYVPTILRLDTARLDELTTAW